MSLTRRALSGLVLGALAAPGVLRAQAQGSARPTLVELFTSQGCSSCPPADALMVKLADDPNFIPVTFATQIWDYLGWPDTLAKPAFTRRHKAYAAAIANRRVYTPQAIVNGRAHCVGSDLSAISKLRANSARAGDAAPFVIERQAESWAITVNPALGGARLVMIPVSTRQSVEIGRGENSGRTVTYANVARDIVDLGEIPFTEHRVSIDRKDILKRGADAFVIVAQAGTPDAPGMVLGAGFASTDGAKV
jgi:hypothetical protein